MSGASLELIRFDRARGQIRDSDLLLYRRRGLISIAGRGDHSHAAKAAWWEDEIFCLEVREWHGGRAVTLASQVRRHPARIDVFETNPDDRWPEYDRDAATRVMRRLAGCGYGYAGVASRGAVALAGGAIVRSGRRVRRRRRQSPAVLQRGLRRQRSDRRRRRPRKPPGRSHDAAGRPGPQSVLSLPIHLDSVRLPTCDS